MAVMACVSSTLVASRFHLFQSCVVDLRLDRSVHACGHECRGVIVGQPCGSVHYGRCEPLPPAPAAPGGPPTSPSTVSSRQPKIRVNFRAKPLQPGCRPVQVSYTVSTVGEDLNDTQVILGTPPPKPNLPPSGAAAAAVATSRTMQVVGVNQHGVHLHPPVNSSVRHRSVAAPHLPPKSPPLPLPAVTHVSNLQIGALSPPTSPPGDSDSASDTERYKLEPYLTLPSSPELEPKTPEESTLSPVSSIESPRPPERVESPINSPESVSPEIHVVETDVLDSEDYLKMPPGTTDVSSEHSAGTPSSTPGRDAVLSELTATSSSNDTHPTVLELPPTTEDHPQVAPGGPPSPRPPTDPADSPVLRLAPGAGASLLPQFHHPHGGPLPNPEEMATTLTRLAQVFDNLPGKVASDKEAMRPVLAAVGMSFYWRQPLFSAAGGREGKPVSKEAFLTLWKKLMQTCGDKASQFVRVITKGQRNHIVQEDLVPLMQDVVDAHPGLQFLQEAPEFHSRYVHTVIARIFFEVNRSWSWKITASELRQSNFLETLDLLESEEDINAVTDFFSYEHFYVIYCKFWELDQDHDLFINKDDLARHNNFTLSDRIVERIFSGCVFRGTAQQEGRMPYTDFVWFLIAEEDKRHPRSIEYWFRCMDLDGDGVLSLYELEYFYSEQIRRMEEARIEDYLGLEDCLCAMLDLVKPVDPDVIRLSDLKKCKLAHIFFDTMFNLYKFLMNEQKDPFSNLKELQEAHLSDWEKYANEMYDVLVREGEGEEQDEYNYSDDFDNDEDDAAGSTCGGLLGVGMVVNNNCSTEDTNNTNSTNPTSSSTTKDRLAFLDSNNLWES